MLPSQHGLILLTSESRIADGTEGGAEAAAFCRFRQSTISGAGCWASRNPLSSLSRKPLGFCSDQWRRTIPHSCFPPYNRGIDFVSLPQGTRRRPRTLFLNAMRIGSTATRITQRYWKQGTGNRPSQDPLAKVRVSKNHHHGPGAIGTHESQLVAAIRPREDLSRKALLVVVLRRWLESRDPRPLRGSTTGPDRSASLALRYTE